MASTVPYHDQLRLVIKTKVQTEWVAAVAAVALDVRQDANLLSLVSALAKPHKFRIPFHRCWQGHRASWPVGVGIVEPTLYPDSG